MISRIRELKETIILTHRHYGEKTLEYILFINVLAD